MLDYIKGTLASTLPDRAVIEIDGIGYRLFISLSTYEKLPQVGETTKLYITTVIREDAHKRYGFGTSSERDFFEKLLDISGIGPRLALSLLGHLTLSELHLIVQRADAKALAKVPGIGKKTSERLILELGGKFDGIIVSPTGEKEKKPLSSTLSDAVNALINLGYGADGAQKAVEKAIEQAGKEPPLPELLNLALRTSR